jgi:ankyrin repeat protein
MDLRLDNIENAAYNTCEWFITHPRYIEWIQARSRLLWIKGKPGAGKSTLMKYALRQDQQNYSRIMVGSFFFNARGSPLESSPLGLYRSILHQLLVNAPLQLSNLTRVYRERCNTWGDIDKKWNWRQGELEEILSDLLLTTPVPVRLYIDALDEGGEEISVQLVEQFQAMIDRASSSGKSLMICFSCRHYPIITLDDFAISLENENSADIQTYVHQTLRANFVKETPAKLLAAEILERANGVFQWIKLVVPRVLSQYRRGKRIDVIQMRIRELPRELHNLYRSVLDTITNEERRESLKLLQWMCFAFRPLSLSEIRHAMVLDADTSYQTLQELMNAESYVATDDDNALKARIIDLSRGLAEIREHDGQFFVQYIHESVKDFLVQDGLQSLDKNGTGSTTGRGNLHLAWACARYLSISDIDPVNISSRRLISKYPLLLYATVSWIQHVMQIINEPVLQTNLTQLFDYFHKPLDIKTQRWVQLHRKLDMDVESCPGSGMTMLHIMARHGFFNSLSVFLGYPDTQAYWKDDFDRTPLSWAAAAGHEDIVKLLLDQKDVSPDSEEHDGRTALSWAAENGHPTIVQMLLNRNVRADLKDDVYAQTPLSLAAENGHYAVVKLLLDRDGIDVNSKDHLGRTPLRLAAANGHKAIVELLVNTANVEVDTKDNTGQTALSSAAERGKETIVKFLVNREDVEADSKDNLGRTPLSLAADYGYKGVVKLLVDRDDVEADLSDNRGRKPLSWAALSGHKAVVRLLVDRDDVNVDSKDMNGRTPLSLAAEGGHAAIVQLLVDRHDVIADSKDKEGRTPLSWAAQKGCGGVVELLLSRNDVEAESKDNRYERTPLFWAVMREQEMVLRLLLSRHDVRADTRDNSGLTPFMWVCGRGAYFGGNWGDYASVKLLIDRDDVDVNAKDNIGRTALSLAVEKGNEDVVRLLIGKRLKSDVEADTIDNLGRTPLSLAVMHGYRGIEGLLVDCRNARSSNVIV